MTNLILTGIPRSGTTLAASLIDAAPNSLCLNEPSWQHAGVAKNAAGFADYIMADFARAREHILAGIPIPDRRAPDGSQLTNYYDGAKENFVMYPLTRKNLSPDFTLAMKHNGPYLAVLPELLARGAKVRAVVREPLPVIRSWRRLNLPISRGELPNATPFWLELKLLCESSLPLLEKQVRIYTLMHSRIMGYADKIEVVRYEEMVTEKNQLSDQETDDDEAIIQMLHMHIRPYAC